MRSKAEEISRVRSLCNHLFSNLTEKKRRKKILPNPWSATTNSCQFIVNDFFEILLGANFRFCHFGMLFFTHYFNEIFFKLLEFSVPKKINSLRASHARITATNLFFFVLCVLLAKLIITNENYFHCPSPNYYYFLILFFFYTKLERYENYRMLKAPPIFLTLLTTAKIRLIPFRCDRVYIRAMFSSYYC